jgi:Helix-turn-helix domain
MFVLADCYNEDYHLSWPSVRRLATASLITERHARRILRALETKGLVQLVKKHGMGQTNGYRFPGYSPDVTHKDTDIMSGLSESNTGQTHHRSRTSEHRKPDIATSGEPKETETPNMNDDPEEREFYARELTEMRRQGSIGRTTRNVYRTQLENPTESASLPEWFRREAEDILKCFKETSSDSNSTRTPRG